MVHEGEADIAELTGLVRRRVNVIDTLGFCDSTLCKDAVVRVVQDWLRIQAVMIDCFVIVVSNRIELDHAESIKKMLDWSNFDEYPLNFVFVCNKADLCPDEDTLQTNVALMVEQLRTGGRQLCLWRNMDDPAQREMPLMPLNMACGIPPTANPVEIQELLQPLCDSIFVRRGTGRTHQRVPVTLQACTIL